MLKNQPHAPQNYFTATDPLLNTGASVDAPFATLKKMPKMSNTKYRIRY